MREAISNNLTIVYLDEVMFTVRTIMSQEYSNVGINIQVNPQDFHIQTTAVIAGITREHGMLINECYRRSVNT